MKKKVRMGANQVRAKNYKGRWPIKKKETKLKNDELNFWPKKKKHPLFYN